MLEPVEHVVVIDTPRTAAFAAFVEDIGAWWPVKSFSIAEGTVHAEPRFDGKIIETAPDGTPHLWGHFTIWDAPDKLAIAWLVGTARVATAITVSFTEDDAGQTRVTLVHSGWDDLGAEGAEKRANYDQGWDRILDQSYAKYARAHCPKPLDRGTDI